MKRRKQWCLIVRLLKKDMCTALDLQVKRWPSVLSLRFIAIWNIPVEGWVDVELLLLSMAAIKHHFMINDIKMNMHDHDEKMGGKVEFMRINDIKHCNNETHWLELMMEEIEIMRMNDEKHSSKIIKMIDKKWKSWVMMKT